MDWEKIGFTIVGICGIGILVCLSLFSYDFFYKSDNNDTQNTTEQVSVSTTQKTNSSKTLMRQEDVVIEELKESKDGSHYAIVKVNGSDDMKIVNLDSSTYEQLKVGDKILCDVTYVDGEVSDIKYPVSD